MLRYRDYEESEPTSRFMFPLVKAVGCVVAPVLRLLCRVIPPLRRGLEDTSGVRLGAAFGTRDRGDHRGAFTAAMDGMARCSRLACDEQRADIRDDVNALYWWMFLDLAVHEAEHLGDAERAQVAQLLDAAPAPGGMLAAACLCQVARWAWTGEDQDRAILLARQAVLADSSYAHAHVLLGWYGLVTGRFDPLPHLRNALKVDPACREVILANPDFAGAPGLLRSLGLGGTS